MQHLHTPPRCPPPLPPGNTPPHPGNACPTPALGRRRPESRNKWPGAGPVLQRGWHTDQSLSASGTGPRQGGGSPVEG